MDEKKEFKFVDILIGEEEKKAVLEILENKEFAYGKYVDLLEKEFARYIGTKYALAVSNGTDGLFLANLALGLTFKKKVLTTPMTFIATASSILHAGAIPIFSDVKNDSNMDPDYTRKIIKNEKIDGISVVHLYGKPVDIDIFKELTDEYDIPLIEDASHAHGAVYKNKKIGSWGDIAVFSLYPTKVIAAGGWGGIITTNDEEIYEKLIYLRAHGEEKVVKGKEGAYIHSQLGYNFRMSNIEAAIAYFQLKRIDEFIEQRRKNAKVLREILEGIDGITLPGDPEGGLNVFYIFNLVLERKGGEIIRDKVVERAKALGIPAERGYHTPLHKQPLFRNINDVKVNHLAKIINYPNYNDLTLPKAEKLARTTVWLPVHPGLSEEDMSLIGNKFLEILREYGFKSS